MKHPYSASRLQQGSTLIEVLVTVVILAIGLLALAVLQMRLQANELESYQRAQALTLLDDMRARIEANRRNAASYVTGVSSPLGANMTCPSTTGSSTRQQLDAAQWCQSLQGSAEQLNGKIGAMIGARGCIEQLTTGRYMVTIAWQGTIPQYIDPTLRDAVDCGHAAYDNGAECTDDKCRRFVTTVVTVGTLT